MRLKDIYRSYVEGGAHKFSKLRKRNSNCKYFLENRASESIGVNVKSIVSFGHVTGFWIIEFHVSFLTDIY